MQRIPMAAKRADRNPTIAKFPLKFAERRGVLDHRKLAMRIARIPARSQFHGRNPKLLNLREHLVQRKRTKQRGKNTSRM